MPDSAQLISWMQTHPGLFAATVGMVLSSSYVLLMLVTRLGDVKPGVQSFVLSGLIHLIMALFWGTLVIPGGKIAQRKPPEPVRIRQVIVEDNEALDQPGASTRAVWDRLPTPRQEDFTRIDAQPTETTPLETPNRTPEVVEPLKGSLPDLPEPLEVAITAPQPLQATDPTPRNAADQMVDIAEETAESRPDVVVANTAPLREMSDRVGTISEEVQRTPRKGQNPNANVTVQMSNQPAFDNDLLDDNSTERKQTESQVTQRRTGPVQAAVEIEDAGVPDGQSRGEVASGSQNPSKFTRAGLPLARNDISGTVERNRTTARPDGNNPRAPSMASLSTGRSREVTPFTERPGISRPSFNAIPSRESASMPDTYRLRNLPQRQKVAVQLGATQESERAVELSLRWLALHQTLEGYWDADGFDANCPTRDRCWGKGGQGNTAETEKINNPVDRLALQSAGQNADTGLTALVMLTFLGAGYTHEEGQYADQVDRAVRWLIRQQQSNGYLGGGASHYERMYCHGMATYALGEACGMMDDPDSDPQLRQALAKAVRYIIAMQNPNDGGWRYMDGHLAKQEGDMSMFGWQLMALKSSQIAGVEIPEETQAGMIKFLKRISLGERRGLASYRYGEGPKASMTAEALFSRQMLGMKRDNPSSIEAVEYLMKHPPHQTEQDLYYWYYGTLAMYQYGGEPWRRWNDQLRDTLVATQRKTGHASGSWDPRDHWSQHGGRLYSTALSTLCLEVYYRFLPLYQLNGSAMDDIGNKP